MTAALGVDIRQVRGRALGYCPCRAWRGRLEMVELKSPYKTQHLLKGSNSSETKMLYLLAQ